MRVAWFVTTLAVPIVVGVCTEWWIGVLALMGTATIDALFGPDGP